MLWIKRINNSASSENKSDAELIDSFKSAGDASALGILFERYVHLVYGVCMKYLKNTEESRDATMQIFEKIRFDLQKHKVEKFSFWLHTVSKNYCLMQLRSKDAMKSYDDTLLVTEDGVVKDNIADFFGEKNTDHLLEVLPKALENLNTEQRICVELFYLKEKCYEEISSITGYEMKKVKSYIQNGKRNLKIFLTNQMNEHERHDKNIF
jgi:RNA polymerase sigma-70 factor (ECF subfamily)